MRHSRRARWLGLAVAVLIIRPGVAAGAEAERPIQYLLVNRAPGPDWFQNRPDSITREDFEEVRNALPQPADARIRVGLAWILSYLHAPDHETLQNTLRRILSLAEETDTPVFIQLDGENWWNHRPDLWNWWDPERPGYDPANRRNVEWTGRGPEHAIRIAWRNWGRQLRVLPPPNLMSPAYRQACREGLEATVPVVLAWAEALPPERKHLFVGIKVGHESSIGVNAWYYPDGNALADRPAGEDPTSGLDADDVLARGVVQIGYAAVATAGIRTEGSLTEDDLAEVVRRHLADLSRVAAGLGVPRDRLFTHAGGWAEGEKLYDAALNEFACPGWSFYRHAADPREDAGVQRALRRSDAPFWGAVEWLYQGPREVEPWRRALEATLADPRCRILCIYNWEGIRNHEPILEAIRQVVGGRLHPHGP